MSCNIKVETFLHIDNGNMDINVYKINEAILLDLGEGDMKYGVIKEINKDSISIYNIFGNVEDVFFKNIKKWLSLDI